MPSRPAVAPIALAVLALLVVGLVATAPIEARDALGPPATPTPIPLVWTQKAGMPTARQQLAVAGTGAAFYAIGGIGTGGAYLATNERYDTATDAWTTHTGMPTARAGLGAAVKVHFPPRTYAIGGYNGDYLGTNEMYDPFVDKWTTRASMPTPRRNLAVVRAKNGRIYAIGGASASGPLATVEAYNPYTDAWATRAPMPSPREGHGAALGTDGRIYVIGGLGSGAAFVSGVAEYNPATDTWTSHPGPSTAPNTTALALVEAHTQLSPARDVFLIGGLFKPPPGTIPDDVAPTHAVRRWDTADKHWVSGGVIPLPQDRAHHAAITLGKPNKVYVVGGVGDARVGGRPVATLYVGAFSGRRG